MKALVWLGPRQMEFQDIPEPEPDEHDVVLRVDMVSICGSELSGYLGGNSLRLPPLIMGHEFCGTVARAGGAVVAPPIGAHVVVNPTLFDGTCALCARGRQNLCLNRSIVGVHTPGAFAEYVKVPARACLPLPADMSHSSGALIEPAACAVRVVEVGRIGLGDTVLVLGAGPVGLMIVEAARAAGAAQVIATDINRSRLDAARAFGASHVVEAPATDLGNEVLRLTDGLGCDVAVDAVGAPVTRQRAVASVMRGGRVILFGLHEDESALPGNHLVRSEIEVTGAFIYTPPNFSTAIDMVARGFAKPSSSWLDVRPLSAGSDAFRELIDDPSVPAKIQLQP